MKRYLFISLFVVCVMTLSSCSSTRYVSESLKVSAPTDIPLIEPYTDVFYIEKGNQAQYNDSLTCLAHETLLDCLEDNASWFPYGKILYLDDKDVWIDMAGDMEMFLAHCRESRRGDVPSIPIPESLAAFMAANNLPYAMMLYHSGLTRSWKNYTRAVATDVAVAVGMAAVGILLGGVAPVVYGSSIKATSRFTVAVANAAEGTVSFYNSVEEGCEPLDRVNDYELLKRLFRKYPSAKY